MSSSWMFMYYSNYSIFMSQEKPLGKLGRRGSHMSLSVCFSSVFDIARSTYFISINVPFCTISCVAQAPNESGLVNFSLLPVLPQKTVSNSYQKIKHRSIIVNGLLKGNLEKNCTKMTEQSKQPILNECTKHHFCSNFANGARKAPLEKQRQRRHRWGCIRNFTIIAKKVNCDWLINNQESLMGTMPLKWKCLCVHCLWNSIFLK